MVHKNSFKGKIYARNKDVAAEVAARRINELFKEANLAFAGYPHLSDRYVFLARKIAMKFKTGFTREQKIQFCKSCSSFLRQNVNSTIRLSKGNIVVKCLKCKNIRRLKYK